MKPSLRLCLGAWSAAWLLAACGGGSDSGSDSTETVKPTAVAQATPDIATLGALVQLDGSASTTPNGNTLNYAWTLLAPANSTAALSSTTAQRPTFTADAYGSYVADLVVNDGTASSEHARVTVSVPNTDPIAITAPALSAKLGDTITLDGSQSLAPTGSNASALSYQWTLLEKPETSQASLQQANAAIATLEADALGEFKAQLVVNHDNKASTPATVIISVASHNSIPVANPGGPYAAIRGQAVQLDGTNSHDEDPDQALSYRWTLTRPLGSVAELSANNTAKPSFTPDIVGTYQVSLIVFDGISRSIPVSTEIVVRKPDNAVNQPPVVKLQEQASYTTERGSYLYFYSDAYDPDGDPLTYEWCWADYPPEYTPTEPCLTNRVDRDYVYVRASVDGKYTMQLKVSDGEFTSAAVTQSNTVTLGANIKPTAVAKADIESVMINTLAWLDGSGSSDRNGDKLSYAWTLLDTPDGSQTKLQQTTSERVSFIPDVAGAYIAELVVTDSDGAASNIPARTTVPARVTVMAKTKNHEPVVRADTAAGVFSGNKGYPGQHLTSETPYLIDSRVQMNVRANSYDPDGDTLQYLWTLQRPEGSTLLDGVAGTQYANWQLYPDVPGRYIATVAVSDGIASSTQTLEFHAVTRENYPNLLLESSENLSYALEQAFFPYSRHPLKDNGYYIDAGTSQETSNRRYRLTAYDQDYTITGLTAHSTDSSYMPGFIGLTDGQRIRKGESVDFSIYRPYVAGESKTQSVTTAQLAAYDFTWSFRIAEKPDWTFEIKN